MVDKAFKPGFYPADLFVELMELRDADMVYVLMQIRNLILIAQTPIRNDPTHIGKACDMSRAKTERVIHRLIHILPTAPIYLTDKGEISCKLCENQMEKSRVWRKGQSDFGYKGAEKRWRNEQKQPDENGVPMKPEMPNDTLPIPKERSNINPIPVLGTAREGLAGEGRVAGFKSLAGVVGGMLGAVRSAGFNVADFLTDHELRQIREYAPDCAQEQVINLFNHWVADKKIEVRNPRGLFIDWLKSSQSWLKQTAGHA